MTKLVDREILGFTWWYTSQGSIGIVKVHTHTDQIKYYIGIIIQGDLSKAKDHISEHGAPFDPIAGAILIPD